MLRPRPLLLLILVALALAPAAAAADSKTLRFEAVVASILAEPYQPAYVPMGNDTAFDQPVPNTFPVEDYTSGSRQGSPDAPPWPAAFREVLVESGDGAPLLGRVALHEGNHPGVVVAHGFNSNAKDSVVRWAAMLYANGYHVAAIDARDFPPEWRAGYGYPNWLQTFGWKEAQDVIAAGRYLKRQPGVGAVGVVGFSLGGQNAVLAAAQDSHSIFDAVLNFSGPASENAQIYSTAEPPGCTPPFCTYPVTSALVQIVVPPFTYSDPCVVLEDAGRYYGTTPAAILAREHAFRAQETVRVPLLNLYARDDALVRDFQARMMRAYNAGNPLQATIELELGMHAYFYDRWWQQRVTLLYFKRLLPGAAADESVRATPTVNQTAGGAAAGDQLVDLGFPSRAEADALVGPVVCPDLVSGAG